VHGSAAIVNTAVVPRIMDGLRGLILAIGQVRAEWQNEFASLNACFAEFSASRTPDCRAGLFVK
jgi:hypothetical protein